MHLFLIFKVLSVGLVGIRWGSGDQWVLWLVGLDSSGVSSWEFPYCKTPQAFCTLMFTVTFPDGHVQPAVPCLFNHRTMFFFFSPGGSYRSSKEYNWVGEILAKMIFFCFCFLVQVTSKSHFFSGLKALGDWLEGSLEGLYLKRLGPKQFSKDAQSGVKYLRAVLVQKLLLSMLTDM